VGATDSPAPGPIGPASASPRPPRAFEPLRNPRQSRSRSWSSLVELDHHLRERSAQPLPEPGRCLPARVLHLTPGLVDLGDVAAEPEGWLGLLILDGLIVVELDLGRGHVGWLVGANDFLRPWDMRELCLTSAASWRALTPSRVVLLDEQFSLRSDGLPAVTRAMVSQAALTTHWLLAKSLIISVPLIEERLVLLFALLGERWGKMTPAGVVLNLPLTHRILAHLCGARRPSVTIALRTLGAQGVVERTADHAWLLRRPRVQAGGFHPACWSRYVEALGLQ